MGVQLKNRKREKKVVWILEWNFGIYVFSTREKAYEYIKNQVIKQEGNIEFIDCDRFTDLYKITSKKGIESNILIRGRIIDNELK